VPTFTDKDGQEVYIPFHGMQALRAEPTGLETTVMLGGGLLVGAIANNLSVMPFSVTVRGTLDTVKLAFIQEHLRIEHGIIPPETSSAQ
jgi:hypothetical protein